METKNTRKKVNLCKIETEEQETQRCCQKIVESEIIICSSCKKQLSQLTFIFSKDLLLCVGCFGKIIEDNQFYSVVNISKKYEKENHSLVHELRVIQSIEKYGIDSTKLIVENLRDRVNPRVITNIMNSFTQNQQREDEQFDEIEKSKCYSRSEDTFLLDPLNLNSKIDGERSLQSAQWKILFERGEELPDLLLASLHQKSSAQHSDFLLKLKHQQSIFLQLIEQNMKMTLFNIKIMPSIKLWSKEYPSFSSTFDDEDNLQKNLEYKNKEQQQINALFNLLANQQKQQMFSNSTAKKNVKIKIKSNSPTQLNALQQQKRIKTIKIRKIQDESLLSVNKSQKKELSANKTVEQNRNKQRKFIKPKNKKKIRKQR